MSKVIFYLGFIGAGLLFVATVWLAYQNRNKEVSNTLTALLLGAIVSTFLAVSGVLKEHRDKKTFSTFVVFDSVAGTPVFITPKKENFKLTQRLSDLAILGRPTIKVNDKDVPLIKPPKANEEMTQFCQELLQYKIIKDILNWQKGGWTMMAFETVSSQINNPVLPTRMETFPRKDLYQKISQNRFAQGQTEAWQFENMDFKLPEKTDIELIHIPSSPKTGREKFKILLFRPGFFKIEICIEPMGNFQAGALPTGLTIPENIKPKDCHTFFYEITMSAFFEKYTSGNWQTEELKKWAEWLLSEIQSEFSD